MAADNTVTLVGNITRDPELRFTPSGQAVATFGLAVNRRWQNRQTSEWEEQTSFFDVKCWAQMAENVAESVTRGSRVVVSGRLEQRSWETDQGDKRSKVEVVADEVAPSLRWATAQISRNERRDGDGGGSGGGGGRGGYGGGSGGGGGRDSGASSSGGGGSSSGSGGGGGGYGGGSDMDEEPF
jgi:single-strand DNA-binding protein